MKIDVITIFPEIFPPLFNVGMLRLAQEKELLEVKAHDLRDFTQDKYRQVDDEPYGGGPGMVMKPEPFFWALKAVLGYNPFLLPQGVRTILLTPQGQILDQQLVADFAQCKRLVLLCGRYEGVDERISTFVSDEVSLGDFVLSGGEFAALALVDAVTRLIPGVLGEETSLEEESFISGQLEYPQYTRPVDFLNLRVPGVLLSGDHKAIASWRKSQGELRTKVRRPDLLK